MKRLLQCLFAIGLFAVSPAWAATDCWIAYSAELAEDGSGNPMPILSSNFRVIRVQTITGTEQSPALPNNARVVTIVCEIQVFVEKGTNPTATQDSFYLPANTLWSVGVDGGDKFAFCDADCA